MTAARGEDALDGLKVDQKGNLYVSGPGGLWILSREGKHLGTIAGPEHPHNFAWGDDDGKTLYLCAKTGLYRIRLNIPGIRPKELSENMDYAYAIRLAKTKLRDAYANGDIKGVLSVFGDGFSDMSSGLASFYGVEARLVLKHRLTKLFEAIEPNSRSQSFPSACTKHWHSTGAGIGLH